MKYKCYRLQKKNDDKGGDYWRGVNVNEHQLLTQYQTTFQYVIKTFPPAISILEAGCGLGRWLIPLANKGYNVTGIEIENEAVEIIKKTVTSKNINIVQGDIFKMPFANKSFDLILSLGVLEHFEDKKIQNKAIAEHIRVLKDDGVFLITVPYFSFLRLIIHLPYIYLLSIVRFFKGKKQYFTEYRYGLNTFKKNLNRNNLKIEKIVWDDLLPPYSFGLMDYPLRKFTFSKEGIQYKLSKTGLIIQKLLWTIHPSLISGGIGFVCKKK